MSTPGRRTIYVARLPRLPRPTIRLRLTLLYGALFLLTGAVLLGLTYVTSATTGLVVRVRPDGEVAVTFGGPFGGGGSNTQVAPFGGTSADVPKLLQSVVAGQYAAEQHYYLVLSLVALVILSLASVLIGWFVAGRVLRPLRTMTEPPVRSRARTSSSDSPRPAPTTS